MYGRLRQAIEIDTATNTVRIPSSKEKVMDLNWAMVVKVILST